MAYCKDCDINYQNDDMVCTGCGQKLIMETEAQQVSATSENDQPLEQNTGIVPNRDSIMSGKTEEDETHIGKGLIKPNLVEQDLDGFHFKYDKPPSNSVKAEIVKNKVVEFRLTCPDPESEEVDQKSGSATNMQSALGSSESVLAQEMSELTPGMESEAAEPLVGDDNIEPLIEKQEWIAGEISDDTLTVDLEPESTPDQVLPEPELETTGETKEIEVFWEDTQRWLGIPLSKQYRITNRSLQVIDGAVRRFSEVDLNLITAVKLRQSWLGKLFGTGDLVLTVPNLPNSQLVLTGVRNPEKVLQLLEKLLSQ